MKGADLVFAQQEVRWPAVNFDGGTDTVALKPHCGALMGVGRPDHGQ